MPKTKTKTESFSPGSQGPADASRRTSRPLAYVRRWFFPRNRFSGQRETYEQSRRLPGLSLKRERVRRPQARRKPRRPAAAPAAAPAREPAYSPAPRRPAPRPAPSPAAPASSSPLRTPRGPRLPRDCAGRRSPAPRVPTPTARGPPGGGPRPGAQAPPTTCPRPRPCARRPLRLGAGLVSPSPAPGTLRGLRAEGREARKGPTTGSGAGGLSPRQRHAPCAAAAAAAPFTVPGRLGWRRWMGSPPGCLLGADLGAGVRAAAAASPSPTGAPKP